MLRFFEPEANTRWLVAGAHPTPQLKADAVSPAESPAVAVRRSSSLPAKANYLVKHQWHPSLFPTVSDVNLTTSPSPDASSPADSLKNASSGGGGGGVISWQDAGVFRRQASDPFLETFQGGRSSSLAADTTTRSIKLKHGELEYLRKRGSMVHELDESNKMADHKRQRSSGDEKLYFLPSFDHPSSKTRVTINQTTKEPAKNQKLGDKITALQQLVSPFGKTDTASVLQEATVYIKALHEQLAFQILSRSRFETNSPGSIQGKRGGGQSKLYDWGLCIVPVSPAIISFANQECPNYSTGELINQIN